MGFDQRIAVVTGGGQGIGAAAALDLLDKGARVAVLDLDCAPLTQQLAAHPDMAARCLRVPGDCTDAAVVSAFFGQVEEDIGPVDILFNNVGQSARERGGLFVESQETVWRFVLEVSLLTTMRASRRIAPGMKARGFGRIVNMSTDAAFAGDVGLADYAAAKMGVVGFTRSLARELAPHGVTVNAVCPGAIRTRAHDKLKPEVLKRIVADTPAGFVGSPQDVAAAVRFLASEEARFITGQTLLIDGGRWML
ncbi:acetoacetyl-CoA reductase/3-oxoacyl-[acyl-carrier protein] reductase [Variovorax sp. SG517]|uniref:SDR family NAD(P)-dependent oxidoreductase n=1 Tax=Variovorax sp. SG517 TaxID=2587117 RepID=UPI00159E8CA7|nr:SDR family oxidoreductase [Variovorax sp. SG517]NVM92999.1 acetoacetyl-CoA reductase/3-oxoacyl-[acyl-carrier protein] reductase [Variovorax sp. SG517]